MFQVKARTSTVVIGEHVVHVDRPTLFQVVPPELAERPDLVTICDALDEPVLDSPDTGKLTAEGVDLSAQIGGDPDQAPANDEGDLGVTLLRIEGEDEDDEGGASADVAPDPFADDDTQGTGAPVAPASSLPKAPPQQRTRTSSGGCRK